MEQSIRKKFDFLFIGLGAANCLLILRLHESGLLKNKSVAIIEPDSKVTNDRTFCFWATKDELDKLHLEKLVSYSWDNITISGITTQHINPLSYYHIKGIDIYVETKKILTDHNVTFYPSLFAENPIITPVHYEITLDNQKIYADKVFDNRPPVYLAPQKNQSHLYQSFYGWKVKTKNKKFDTSTVVMMDFNVTQSDFTQFIYVLPYTEDTALIELTRFGDQKLVKDEAHLVLENYIEENGLSIEILDIEQGIIPMSSAKMNIPDFGKNWINMGARADMLKCSTGYAFHAMAEDAQFQMEAIQSSGISERQPRDKRFKFYDRLLLQILTAKPQYGKIIFETLFQKVTVTKVLSFMREKTTFTQEVFIFSKLPKGIFIKTALKDIVHQLSSLPILIMPFVFTLLTLLLSLKDFEYVSWSILGIGFLSVGLSHGALDHLTDTNIINKQQLLYFVVKYLLKGALFGLIWFVLPDLALMLFITYSAWHFGQADFKEWGIRQGWQSLTWGVIVLMSILFLHFEELNWVLNQIPNLKSAGELQKISSTQLLYIQTFIISGGFLMAVVTKSKHILLTLTYLLLCSFLPLLLSFGIYFVGQHSMHGWRHISAGLKNQSPRLWLKSLPFSIAGALLITYFLFYAGTSYAAVFFIVLSCMSIPHIFSMHRFYASIK